jgi:hypothetical protein
LKTILDMNHSGFCLALPALRLAYFLDSRLREYDRIWGVQRGEAPLRPFPPPFIEDPSQADQRGIQGDLAGDEAEVSTAHASGRPSVRQL